MRSAASAEPARGGADEATFITMDVPYPPDDERLRDNIRAELQTQRAMADLELSDEALDRLAESIASSIDYAFSVRWSPRWAKPGEPHRWTEPLGEEPTEHFVECIACKRITVHRSEAEADAWSERHLREAHT